MAKGTSSNIINNIVYVEPNYTNSTSEYDVNGLNTYEFVPPLEDYSIYVNLEVETRGRNVQSTKTSGNRKLVMSFVSTTDGKSAVNFMQGSKIPIGEKGATINSLTTNYTDIFIKDLKQNGPSTELFGIKSIDIAYNNYMVPEVTIEFVDVRGVALFAQKEYYETNKNIDAAIDSQNQENIANTFFQCFFTFPYPKFTLLVKGFYGQPVAYELTCADFRARFESSTGNFACTAKFVGYHFSFLNDTMLNGLIAAPYSDYIGAEYWQNKKFTLTGLNGEDVELPKIGWLLDKMKEIEADANKISQSDPVVQEKNELDDKKKSYATVEDAYNKFAEAIEASIPYKDIEGVPAYFSLKTNNGFLRAAALLAPSENPPVAKKKEVKEDPSIDDRVKSMVDTVEDYVLERGAKTVKNFVAGVLFGPAGYVASSVQNIKEDISGNDDVKTNSDKRKTFEQYVNDRNRDIKNAYERLIDALDTYNNNFPDEKLPKPIPFYNSHSSRRIYGLQNDSNKVALNTQANSDIANNYPELYNAIKRGLNEGNAKEHNPLLGYKNIYYYHDEKFAETLEEYKRKNGERTVEIEEEIESLKDESIAKALKFYPTVENMTKIVMAHFETFAYMLFRTAKNICDEEPSRTLSSLGITDSREAADVKNNDPNTIVPPFPRVAREVRRQNSTIREESWVGDYSGDFRERDLVHGIINGIKEISNYIKRYEEGKWNETQELSSTPGRGNGSEGALESPNKYPLSPLDLVASSKAYLAGGFDPNEPSSLLGLVALRAIQILSMNHFKDWDEHADVLGVAEAYNFLADHKLSDEMRDKLSAIADSIDDVMEMLRGNESSTIKKPGEGGKLSPWPWRLNPTGGGIISTRDNSTGYLDICKTGSDGYSVPYQKLSWPKIMAEAVNSQNGVKAISSEDYINTKAHYGIKKKNPFTFDTNINRFADMAEKQLKDIDGIEYYRDKIIGESKYSSDKYKRLLIASNAKNIIAYVIENADTMIPSDGSCMLPTSVNAYSAKQFRGGYNMNYFHNVNPGEGSTGWWNSGDGWKTKDGEDVKRKGEDGYGHYLEEFNSRDFTFVEFPGVSSNLEAKSIHTSLFGQKSYYAEPNEHVRGLLFLSSLGYVFDYNKIIKEYVCDESITMCVLPLPATIFCGALLWMNTTEGKNSFKSPYFSGATKSNFYSGSINLLMGLSYEVREKFINTFKYWVTNGVEGDGLLQSFHAIREGLELKFLKRSPDAFFSNLGEIEEKGIFGNGNSDWVKEYDESYYVEITNDGKTDRFYSVMKFLAGELGEGFFRNYITVDEDTKGYIDDGKGLRLGNRDGGPAMVKACNFALAGCVFVKNSKFFTYDNNATVDVNLGAVKSFFNGFLTTIKENAGSSDSSTNSQVEQAASPDDSNTDIKIGIYRYCKMLYDKWIAGLSEKEFNESWTIHSFFEADDKYFHFIDSFYNVSDFIPINVGDFCDQVVSSYRNDQYSLLSFLSSIYAANKFNFLCVQNFINLGSKENMERMFDAIPYTETWEINRHPNFIVMYPYESSNYLADMDNSEYDNDGFMINQPPSTTNKWPEALTSRNANSSVRYSIPAFGVSYGKMYQSYFRDIDISMDNPMVTEQSIKAQFAIACQQNEGEQTGDRSTMYTYGQDLYSIYSNNSYTCNVTMMGCAWVQPLMYFVLNNVPMFRGTYLIEKVTHHIEPGNMTTKFTGVRMANTCTRIARELSARSRSNQTGEGAYNGDSVSIEQSLAGLDNDCPYKEYPLTADLSNVSISKNELENARNAMDILINTYGFTKAAAAGMCGNIYKESSWVLHVTNGIGAFGLCQWLGSRKSKLIGKYGSKPTFAQQMEYIDYEWSHEDVAKSHRKELMAAGTPEDAAVIVRKYFERPGKAEADDGTRKERARKYYDEYTSTPNSAKIKNNNDGHISDIATAFLNALNKTSSASSEKINIGVDNTKSSGDTLWLTSQNKRFGVVLDMILSAYSSKVDEVRWVIPGDGNTQNLLPSSIIVHVKENTNACKVKVVPENNVNGSVPVVVSDKGGIHEHYCKALVKKYKSHTKDLEKNTYNQIDNYDKLFELYKVDDCNKVMEEAGITNGVGGKLQDSIKIDNWDAGKAANFLIRHSLNKGVGICAFAVQQAIIAGGIINSTGNGYRTVLNSISSGNWQLVSSGKTDSAEFDAIKPSVGDVMGMTKNSNWGEAGHICMYCGDGNGWFSDFKQRKAYVYSGVGTYWLMRYKGGAKSTTQNPQLCFKGKCLKS